MRNFLLLLLLALVMFTAFIGSARDSATHGCTRSIFVNISNGYALELWRYEFDITGIGCI